MKIICDCGRENHHEEPFSDFSVHRIACTRACRQAMSQSPEQIRSELEQISNRPLVTPGILAQFVAK